MRRLTRNETLHGTRDGQLPVDARFREHFGLTDREGAVAALLARGCAPGHIAEHLQISPSTAEKHLASLRQKLGVNTSTEAAARVARFSLEQIGGIRDWPISPAHDPKLQAHRIDTVLAEKLAAAPHLEAGVEALRSALEEEGVRALQYVCLPRNALSFQRGEVIERWAAPAALVETFDACGGLLAHPVAHQLFAQPDEHVLLDAKSAEDVRIGPSEIWSTCRTLGFGLSLSFGAPFGPGYVATSMFFADEARERLLAAPRAVVARFRLALLMTHSALFARGLLARTADLTLRERNALTLLAQGKTVDEAAREVGGSSRAVSLQLQRAREKLGASSNAEAIAQAMALNALVFL